MIKNVWYSTEEHQEHLRTTYQEKSLLGKVFTSPWEMIVYTDKGELRLGEDKIVFNGRKSNKNIPKNTIIQIDRTEGFYIFNRYKIEWVRIVYKEQEEMNNSLFAKGNRYSMNKLDRETDELYKELEKRYDD